MSRKKFATFLLAWLMVLSLLLPMTKSVQASELDDSAEKTKTVTLHKLLMSENDLSKWDHDRLVSEGKYDASKTLDLSEIKTLLTLEGEVKDIGGVVFAWAKNEQGQIQFVNKQGKPVYVDATGKQVQEMSAMGARPITPNDEAFNSVNVLMGKTVDNTGFMFETSQLPDGSYEIHEIKLLSDYVGVEGETLTHNKAVPVSLTLPIVNESGVVTNAVVYPKNTEEGPQIDKNVARKSNDESYKIRKDDQRVSFGANYENYLKQKAEIEAMKGAVVPFEVKTKVPQLAEYGELTWSDRMSPGLTLNAESISLTPVTFMKNTDYTITADQSSFELSFTETGLAKLKAQAQSKSVELVLTYNATVNGTSIVDNPEKNDINLVYGNNPRKKFVPPPPVKPNNGIITVTKTWSEGNAPMGVTVKYDLQVKTGNNDNSWRTVKTVTKIHPNFDYTFTGLDDSKEYRVVEYPNGYTPEYSTSGAGQYSVKNYKDTNPKPKNPTSPTIKHFGKKFVKTNLKGDERLTGATFIVLNSSKDKHLAYKLGVDKASDAKALLEAQLAYETAVQASAEDTTIAQLQKARDAAYAAANYGFKWVTGTTQTDESVVLTSKSDGQFAIDGLMSGMYYLLETAAPSGYATAYNYKDTAFKFAVGERSFSTGGDINYDKTKVGSMDATKVVNKKVDIPQTGGIGTIVFTVVGLAVMALAVLALKRNKEAEEQ